MVRSLTQHLVESLMLDVSPRPAAVCDFGVISQKHYRALQYALRSGKVTPEQLDTALGDGPALTKLVCFVGNPYGSVTFRTPYDDMGPAQ